MPNTADEDAEKNAVASEATEPNVVSKETTAKKKTTKKSANSKSSKTSANVVTKSADILTSQKTSASKKVSASKAKQAAVAASNIPDADEDDMEMDIPTSTQPAVVPYERGSSGHYMDTTQLEHFSQKLAEWKQQLMEEVDRTVGHMKDDATNFPDPNDRATQEEEFSLELRTRDRERKLIKKINEAQKRIDDDEYGYCETCGIEIGVNRLEARPTAELCIDCKTLEEIRERQTA